MYRYLLIDSNKNLSDFNHVIVSLFSELITISQTIELEKQLIIIYDHETDVSFFDVIINMMSDTFYDLRIYESYQFIDEKHMISHLSFIQTCLADIAFNRYVYLNDKIILKHFIHHIKPTMKHWILRKFEHDHMMIETLKTYLESNQNMVNAAKQLYVHRNTLIQRIDKFHQETGFDVRTFLDGYLIYALITF